MTNTINNNSDGQLKENSDNQKSIDAQENQIAEAITRFLHRARDIKWSCKVFTPAAGLMMKDRYNKAIEEIESGKLLLASDDAIEKVHGMKKMQIAIRKLDRLGYSRIPEVIETSLFLNLFSAFDAYTGELLTAIYARKPELFSRLNRKVELVDVLTAHSIEDLKRSVLEEEIEAFRRKSYVEQFAELESTFGLPLRKFEKWAEFVECTQRRNLLTHCGGVVSEQYQKICKAEGYPEEKIFALGTKLELGPKYFLPTCELMIEVGLKLGQTLWRKILPSEIESADRHLQKTQYEALFSHNWDRAKIFGEFAVKQTKQLSEVDRRIAIVNYCIALKFSNEEVSAKNELAKVDWSASTNDFKLAEAVLQDQFIDAATLMHRIGKTGEMVVENAYHSWPLFHVFRERPEFLTAYEDVYGHPFVSELKRAADVALTDASVKENEIEARLLNNQSTEPNNSQ